MTKFPIPFPLTSRLLLFVKLVGLLCLVLCCAAACAEPRRVVVTPGPSPAVPTREIVTATPRTVVAADTVAGGEPPLAAPTPALPTPTLGPTATLAGAACGGRLPLRLPAVAEDYSGWRLPALSSELVPAGAMPAVEYLFTQPEDVALVAYRLGYEGIGFYHNAEQPMPLASVTKLVQLVAYGEAVDEGYLRPDEPVPLEALNDYYLPRSDLGAHNEALRELDSDNLRLDDLIRMMMRHSANSAADYLHNLLGQTTVEQTVLNLELGAHSAPCTFLGRFLAMAQWPGVGHSLTTYLAAPQLYGEDVVRLAERYVNDVGFRDQVQNNWVGRSQPTVSTQAAFVAEWDTRGTAVGYARLMAGIANGQIGSAETNALIRSHLEWPSEAFAINQERYRYVGYKNGTLPGVLTTAYYAWPYWSDQPMVVVLFYKDLPNRTYQTWRRQLPHDSFAHWLLSDPQALHIMHVWRDSAAGN